MTTPAHVRTIDSCLLQISTKAFELSVQLMSPTYNGEGVPTLPKMETLVPNQLERLRQSATGIHLDRIAAYGEGEISVTREAVQESIAFIYQTLFTYPFSDDPTPPASFHKTELGRMIAEAYVRLSAGVELLTPTETYRELRVSRQAIYNFVRDGKLHPLYLYGKMMLFAREVEALKLQREEKKR